MDLKRISQRFRNVMTERTMPREAWNRDSLSYWRARILSTILMVGVSMGFFLLLYFTPMVIKGRLWFLYFPELAIWSLALFFLFSPGIAFKIRATGTALMMFVVGMAIILNVGPLSGGPIWLFCFAVIAGVLLGLRAAVLAVLINGLTIAVIGYLMMNKYWGASFPFFDSAQMMTIAGVNFIFLNALAAVSVSVLVRGLTVSREKERRLARSLKEEQVKLETQIRERKAAEAALRENEEKYRNILESIEDGYYEVDIAGNFVFFNDSMCRILRYSPGEMMGINNRDYMDAENAAKIFKTFNTVYRTGSPTRAIDWRLIRKDGTECFVETIVSLIRDPDGKPIGFRGIARDISDRRQLEMDLQQAYKMESIGRLAGGIAHDFNNILYIILGNIELSIQDIPESNPAHTNLARIRTACDRAAKIVRQLLNFSRISEQTLRPVDIVAVIREELKFLRSTIPAFVDIHTALPEKPVTVFADPVQINQILINLCTNAAQAMAEKGGTLKVAAKVVDFKDDRIGSRSEPMSGQYVEITISDTGPGIPDEIKDKVFDPYFTTKEVGKGSGMGLAVVHGIVKNHGGTLSVQNAPEGGAVFKILIPMSDKEPEAESVEIETLARGTETLLFVDDEKDIVEVTCILLKRLGYTVEATVDPLHAVSMFESNPDHFDLVITDMAMPQLDGARLAQSLFEIRPGIPVIVCTGHSDLMDPEKALEMGIAAYVRKPVPMEKMAKAIRTVLDRKKGEAGSGRFVIPDQLEE